MTRLILIRHGESVANVEGRFTRGPGEPLSRRGVEQALATGKRIRSCYRPVALYASPYRRALETAKCIGRAVDLEPEAVEDLHERSFGQLRGQPYESYTKSALELDARERWNHRPPGGESLREVAARSGPALDVLARRHVGHDVVVVSHGGVMAALRGYAEGNYESPPVATDNAGGCVLIYGDGGYRGPFELWQDGKVD